MLKSAYTISIPEKSLISAVVALEYGEIVNIDVKQATPNLLVKLSEKQVALIAFVRDGHPHIDKLIVHAGDPMQVEENLQLQGFKCTRKLRL